MNVPGAKKRDPMMVTTEAPEVSKPSMMVNPPKEEKPAEERPADDKETKNG